MKKKLIMHKNPKSPNSEIFRTLRTNIQFMSTNKKIKTLLVTSTFPGEGKSWVTSNLAVTFAQAGKKVVLIDADMRKGRQYSIFGVSPKPGLSNYLSEAEIDENGKSTKNIGEYIQETEIENLYVIAAGNVPPNPSELLVSPQMLKLLDDLKELCDLVVIDGTPCELVADSIILSRIVDSSIIVAAHKITKKDALERVVKNIQNVGGKLAGVVLNRVPTNTRGYGYGSRYYYYGESSKKEGDKNVLKNIKLEMMKKTKKDSAKMEEDIAKLHKEMAQIQENTKTESNIQNIEQNDQSQVDPAIVQENIVQEPTQQENMEHQEEKSFEDKTNEIMKQINEYIDNEKKN